jgi:hypothetical protein
MHANITAPDPFSPFAFRFYRQALEDLQTDGVPFLLGGAYALSYYTGITRHTKDLDLFVRRGDVRRMLNVFASAGYRTEVVFSHWLGKVHCGDDFVDVIFSSGNAVCPVDDVWFQHAVEGEVFGTPVRLVPAEEMIWQKAFIMERERFDGADVAHLLRARGRQLDWDRLLARFGPNWPVLLAHLVLFRFIYPDDRDSVPEPVLRRLTAGVSTPTGSTDPTCRGTLLSRMQYLVDVEEWGYTDPRLQPVGPMTEEEVIRWTDAGR